MGRRAIRKLGQTEFIALMAMTSATVAFSIDSMLPAMGEIAAELSPDIPNKAQLIITSFVLGMGIGTLFSGPLCDAFGRKPIVLWGAAIYILGAALAYFASSLEFLLIARALSGIGAAGPRIAAMAFIRDLYAGRDMARIISFVMIVFALVPAIAPLMGAAIIWVLDWRGIFLAFILFSMVSALWLGLRQPETLTPENHRPFRPKMLSAGIVEVMSNRQVVKIIAVLSMAFVMLFLIISVSQQIFDLYFDRAAEFPYWFGAIALCSMLGSFLNARIVMIMGMRQVILLTFMAQTALSAIVVIVFSTGMLTGTALFALYLLWTLSLFFVAGLTIGNLNAMGMEPLGHMAGLGASIMSSIATVAAVVLTIPIGFTFDGTPLPIAVGVLIVSAIGVLILRFVEKETLPVSLSALQTSPDPEQSQTRP